MKKISSFILALLLLVYGLNCAAQNEQTDLFLTGKVIDSQGRPVKGAWIHYLPAPDSDMSILEKSGEDGSFRIFTNSPNGRVWITSPLDERVWAMPLQPAINLTPEVSKNFRGAKVSIINEKSVDLGKVRIDIYYGKIRILIDKNDYDRVFKSVGGFYIRVRNRQGNIVNWSTMMRGFDEQNSCLNIALPYGIWKLEIKNSNFDWQELTDEFTLSTQQPVLARFSSQNVGISESETVKKLLKLDRAAALKELKAKGFSPIGRDFEEALERGNLEAAILFLRAGLSPNYRFHRGFDPLTFAIEYPEIVRILIDMGADVNHKTDKIIETSPKGPGRPISEDTPLLAAVYKSSLDSTRLLLQNGASVNETNTYGDSPLSVAVEEGRTEIVRELLKFGADAGIRNSDGKTLLEIATERYDWEIVKLLKSAPIKP